MIKWRDDNTGSFAFNVARKLRKALKSVSINFELYLRLTYVVRQSLSLTNAHACGYVPRTILVDLLEL